MSTHTGCSVRMCVRVRSMVPATKALPGGEGGALTQLGAQELLVLPKRPRSAQELSSRSRVVQGARCVHIHVWCACI